jgi:hypothetical protein
MCIYRCINFMNVYALGVTVAFIQNLASRKLEQEANLIARLPEYNQGQYSDLDELANVSVAYCVYI